MNQVFIALSQILLIAVDVCQLVFEVANVLVHLVNVSLRLLLVCFLHHKARVLVLHVAVLVVATLHHGTLNLVLALERLELGPELNQLDLLLRLLIDQVLVVLHTRLHAAHLLDVGLQGGDLASLVQ